MPARGKKKSGPSSPQGCIFLRVDTGYEVEMGSFRWERSDDTDRRTNGGFLGIFRQGELADDFVELETAGFRLAIGEVSSVVETPLGFHVLRRVEIEEWRARHILVRYEGARGTARKRGDDETAGRSKDEARQLCEKLTQLARRRPADFATMARRYSESPDRVARGSLGVFTRGESIPQIVEQVSRMTDGQIAGPVESDHGFHVLLREPLDPRRFSVIRIPPERAGTPEGAAAAHIARLRERLVTGGTDFATLAREHSRHPRARLGGPAAGLSLLREACALQRSTVLHDLQSGIRRGRGGWGGPFISG